jgi:hypothetical protein
MRRLQSCIGECDKCTQGIKFSPSGLLPVLDHVMQTVRGTRLTLHHPPFSFPFFFQRQEKKMTMCRFDINESKYQGNNAGGYTLYSTPSALVSHVEQLLTYRIKHIHRVSTLKFQSQLHLLRKLPFT